MTATAERSTRLSLGTRTFLVTAALIAITMSVAVAVTAILGQRIARRGIERTLAGAQTAQAALQQLRGQQLQLMSRVLAADPFLVAYIAQAAELVETRSILDILYERQQELGCDFILALDPRGRLLARTDAPDATGTDLSQRPLVRAALASNVASGFWDEGGKLHETVVVPLAKGLDLVGYLAVGFLIDASRVEEAKRIGGTDVVVLSRQGDRLTAVASTLPAEATATVVASYQAASPSGAEAPVSREARLEGRPWILRASSLGDGPGAVVSLASLDAAMATYRQIETVLVVVGLLALLAALAVSYPVSRRLLSPVRRLAAAAEAARRGEYDQSVATSGNDEVARLSRSLHSLLADLREKRDMEAYLVDLAHNVAETTSSRASRPAAGPGARAGETGSAEALATTESAELGPGSILGHRYEILQVVGSGGMGVVYKAWDRQVDEVVALKLLKPDAVADPEQLERMKSELKLARRITHTNVLRTYDFDILDGHPGISMEYVHGVTLRRLLAQSGRLPYSAGLHLARQMCAGLAAAHAEGVLHRDIKPENLILQQNGNAKLADFGIARPMQRAESGRTVSGTVVGTPHYMAPEILRGQEPDARADVYAVGIVLYEIFTGQRPFVGKTFVELVHKHLEAPVPSPRRHWSEMPPALERVILRCLEKDRERRYPSIEDLVADLEALREESAPAVAAKPSSRPGRTGLAVALLAGGALVATRAHAEDALPVGARRVWPTGDVRLRGDFLRDLPGGRADFERVRVLVRLGVIAAPRPWLELGVVGKGALGSDSNRDNPINFDNERSDSISVDGAWVRIAPRPGSFLVGGKMELPLWLTPLVWDDDLRPIGAGAVWRTDVGAYDVLRVSGGWFATDHLYGDDSRFAAAQVGWLWRPGAPQSGEVLVGFLRFDDLDEFPAALLRTNRVTAGRLASDYRLLDLQGAAGLSVGATTLALRMNAVRNLGADADRHALRVIAVLGDAGHARSVELAYAFQQNERDAVLAAVNGDDWWFHSRSRGHMVRAAVGVTSRALLRVSGFVERRDDVGEWTKRLLVEAVAEY